MKTDKNNNKILVMAPAEYAEWSMEQGKPFGRDPEDKIVPTAEAMSVYLRHGEDSGIDKEDYKQMTGLSDEELEGVRLKIRKHEDAKVGEIPKWKNKNRGGGLTKTVTAKIANKTTKDTKGA